MQNGKARVSKITDDIKIAFKEKHTHMSQNVEGRQGKRQEPTRFGSRGRSP